MIDSKRGPGKFWKGGYGIPNTPVLFMKPRWHYFRSKQTENKVCILLPLKIMPDSRDIRLETVFEPLHQKIHQVEDKWTKVLKKVQDEVKAEILDQL